MQFLFGVRVLPEAYVRGFLGDDFQIYSRRMHVWFWLVFFYGPLVPGSYMFGAVLA